GSMVRHAPIHRRSGHSDIAFCCGRNVRGSSPSTSVVPLSNQVTTLNHKRFKGFKMFSDGHLETPCRRYRRARGRTKGATIRRQRRPTREVLRRHTHTELMTVNPPRTPSLPTMVRIYTPPPTEYWR